MGSGEEKPPILLARGSDEPLTQLPKSKVGRKPPNRSSAVTASLLFVGVLKTPPILLARGSDELSLNYRSRRSADASLLLVEVLMNLSEKKVQMFPAPGCFGTNAFWIRSRSNAAGTVPVFAYV